MWNCRNFARRLMARVRIAASASSVGGRGRASCRHSAAKFKAKKNPHQRIEPVRVSIHQIKSLAVTYFHIDKVDTSIGAERFHFRVRKGIGWFPLAMAARQTSRYGSASCHAPAANSDNLFSTFVALRVN